MSMWTRRRAPAQPVLAAETLTGGVHQALRFDRLPDYTRIEDFEDHLATVLKSGVCVFFDGAEPLLLSGRAPAGAWHGLRLELGPEEQAPLRFHVLGPGVDASFATVDGTFLAGEANRRRIDLIRYWYHNAKPYLMRVWNATHSAKGPAGPIDAA
jgi:hypothetical protein